MEFLPPAQLYDTYFTGAVPYAVGDYQPGGNGSEIRAEKRCAFGDLRHSGVRSEPAMGHQFYVFDEAGFWQPAGNVRKTVGFAPVGVSHPFAGCGFGDVSARASDQEPKATRQSLVIKSKYWMSFGKTNKPMAWCVCI